MAHAERPDRVRAGRPGHGRRSSRAPATVAGRRRRAARAAGRPAVRPAMRAVRPPTAAPSAGPAGADRAGPPARLADPPPIPIRPTAGRPPVRSRARCPGGRSGRRRPGRSGVWSSPTPTRRRGPTRRSAQAACARGLRLPAVLGAVRQLDPARLGEALDDRLLRRRRRRATGDLQKTNADGSTTVGWSGWTSSKMTSVINAAHANGTRVVLTVQSFAWTSSQLATPEGAARAAPTARLNLARQIAAAVRDRGADGVNLDFEPIASGYADEFTALVRTIRAELNKVATGLPADLRHDRLDRQLPDRGRDRAGRRRRGLHHGLRLPDVRLVAGRLGRPARRPGLRHRRHGPRLHRPDPGRPRSSSACPYYGRAWSTVDATRSTPRTSRAPSTAPRSTVLYETAPRPRRRARPPLGPGRGRRLDRLPARELHDDLRLRRRRWRQLYYDDAAGAQAEVRPGQPLRPARRRDLGARLRRDPARALPGARGQVHHRHDPAEDHRRRRSARTLISPNGDGRLDTVTVTRERHRAWIKLGWLGRADRSAAIAGPGGPLRERRPARPSPSPGTARDADGTVVPDGAVPDHRVDRRRLGQPGLGRQFVVTVDTTRPRSGRRREPGVDLAERRRPLGRDDARAGRADEPVTGTGRILDANGATVRSGRSSPATSGVRPGTAGTPPGAVVRDGRYTLPRRRVRPGRQPRPSATCRSASTGRSRSVAWSDASFDPRAGQTSRLSFRLDPAGHRHRGDLPGHDARPHDLDGPGRSAPATYGWTWDGKNGDRRRWSSPGPTASVVTATSWIGRDRGSPGP